MSEKKKKPGYTVEMVKAACDDVLLNGRTIRGSAKLHNVPESTLRRRLGNDKLADEWKMGAPSYFSVSEESQLARHCIGMADRGYGYTRWQIIEMAQSMVSLKGYEMLPTKHWFYGFLGRFPQIKMVKPKKREKVRNDVTSANISNYFTELKHILDDYNLTNHPAKIWNVDETGISLDHSPPKVLFRRGCQPFSVTSGRSSTTTLVATVSALGETLPPYIIYKGQRLTQELVSNGMDGSKFTTSDNGWVTSQIFLDFFKHHFLTHVTERPALLLYDGHATHITSKIIEIAKESNVHLFVLPPHSSHMLQPLDVSVFGPFKQMLNSEMHKYLHSHPNTVITRQLLPSIINTAYLSSMTVSNIMAGFRKTGIFPFEPEVVKSKDTTFKLPATTPSTKQTSKERKDNRSIKVLFQNKVNAFDESTKPSEPWKKKRKTFVPPFGAAITELKFRELIQERETKKVKTTPKSTPTTTNSTKKQKPFQPPFTSTASQQPSSSSANQGKCISNTNTSRKEKDQIKALLKGRH